MMMVLARGELMRWCSGDEGSVLACGDSDDGACS